MALDFRPLGPLAASGSSRLFTDWLGAGVPAASGDALVTAAAELAAAIPGAPRAGAAPLFTSAWNSLVAERVGRDRCDDPAVAEHFQPLADLLEGRCDVVVTGQQPGWLGGPLYTLYKVATTIALAERRTRAGRPTIPVFWSADDDDDHAEAFESVCWVPGENEVRRIRAPRSENGRRPLPVGGLRVGSNGAAGQWLEEIAGLVDSPAARDLAERWRTWRQDGRTWAEAQEMFLREFFDTRDLVVVSGNDPRVHAAAGPLYDGLTGRLEELSRLARERGEDLARGGWHAQLTGRSLARPLFRMKDRRREHVSPADAAVEAAQLRPGVMLRALVQDWLMRPAAVVVGPGELAYLRQLDPLYAEMGIKRAPLVPRLAGWIAPAGTDEEMLRSHGQAGASADEVEAWADRAAEAAERELAAVLRQELDVEQARADELARGRARRYRKGVHSLLAAEAARRAEERTPREPVWVFPDGHRQERRLASGCAAAIWGPELAEAMLAAAEEHLDRGLRGDWSEFLINC